MRMMVSSLIFPIYFLNTVTLDRRGKPGSMSPRTCKGHELNKPDRHIFLPGHLHKVGYLGVVEVLDDDNVQFN